MELREMFIFVDRENNMIYWKYADVIILRIILFNQNDESYIEYPG